MPSFGPFAVGLSPFGLPLWADLLWSPDQGWPFLGTLRPPSRAARSILQGQRAWTQIKATAEEQRTLWLEVGVALMYGKRKENRKGGQKFSEWVQEMFPGLHERTARDALWMAEHFSEVTSALLADLTHPMNIRPWFNDQTTTAALPAELQSIAPVSTPVLPQRDAERVSKVLLRAASGDEESETAKRHVEGLAKKHGLTVEALTEAAAAGAPDTLFAFDPAQVEALQDLRALPIKSWHHFLMPPFLIQ